MEFAKFLFEENDYFRCITELKRELYENEKADTIKITNLIVTNYLMIGENNKAINEAFKYVSNSEDIEYNYLLALYLEKKYEIIDTFSLMENSKGQVLKDLSLIFQNELLRSDTIRLNEESKKIFDGYLKIKKKNPYFAMFLSAIVPGLGRFYSERTGDGAFSFMTVVTPALIALYYKTLTENDLAFYISMGTFGMFYIGELYGAFNSANIYHKNKTEEYYKKVILDYSDTVFRPKFIF